MKASPPWGPICLFLTVACARTTPLEGPVKPPAPVAALPSPATHAAFEAALARFAQLDARGAWRADDCRAVADTFLKLSKTHLDASGGALVAANYNAGLAYERCGMSAPAEAAFRAALSAPTLERARLRLALRRGAKRPVEKLIADLRGLVERSRFQNVEALVALAAAQMERDQRTSDRDGPNDLARAKKNLQRALAINDGFLPAYNRLALYYLEAARRDDAGKPRKTPRAGELELAHLVITQGLRRSETYPPFHNTAGLVAVALGRTSEAAASFARARHLDPRFFEAHMNHGAVLLSFRAFDEAESAYRMARDLDPNDYDAMLGLALALRGQVSGHEMRPELEEAQRLLARARSAEPNRPETDFNEARLIEHFEGSSAEAARRAELERAIALYGTFVEKAGDRPEYAEAVKRARERREDLERTLEFMNDAGR